MVGVEIRAVQGDKWVMLSGVDQTDIYFPKKVKGKDVGPIVVVPGKKKAEELSKHSLITLSIKNLEFHH